MGVNLDLGGFGARKAGARELHWTLALLPIDDMPTVLSASTTTERTGVLAVSNGRQAVEVSQMPARHLGHTHWSCAVS